MSEPNPGALLPGRLFQGRYQVVRCLNAGGMGAVYEVVHLETQRRRALKVMLPSLVDDPELRGRFKLEATVAAHIDSEHIVETFDAGVDDATGAPFLVMELLKGEDLYDLLKRRRRLPSGEVVTLLYQAALALQKTHAAGIVHRDLKPENLFVTYRDDGSPRLKLLDFGIAKVMARSSKARQTRTVGTPLFMSPEQVRGDGDIGPAADVLALGHIAYVLLVGEPYWEEEASRNDSVYPILVRVMQGLVEPATRRALRRLGVTLPRAFDPWLVRATALRPADRFPGAIETVTALAAALGVAVPRRSLASVTEGAAPAALPDVGMEPTLEARLAPSSDPTRVQKRPAEASPAPSSDPTRVQERPLPVAPTRVSPGGGSKPVMRAGDEADPLDVTARLDAEDLDETARRGEGPAPIRTLAAAGAIAPEGGRRSTTAAVSSGPAPSPPIQSMKPALLAVIGLTVAAGLAVAGVKLLGGDPGAPRAATPPASEAPPLRETPGPSAPAPPTVQMPVAPSVLPPLPEPAAPPSGTAIGVTPSPTSTAAPSTSATSASGMGSSQRPPPARPPRKHKLTVD
jgi:eukaryotic-like serine/threonine-protein kinase